MGVINTDLGQLIKIPIVVAIEDDNNPKFHTEKKCTPKSIQRNEVRSSLAEYCIAQTQLNNSALREKQKHTDKTERPA